jgi:hypothetical protein
VIGCEFLLPKTIKPLDPIVNPGACIQMVTYHAEKAALEAFERLSDPATVENCEIFLRARPMLVADESAHCATWKRSSGFLAVGAAH